jgi:hypothetical protein
MNLEYNECVWVSRWVYRALGDRLHARPTSHVPFRICFVDHVSLLSDFNISFNLPKTKYLKISKDIVIDAKYQAQPILFASRIIF